MNMDPKECCRTCLNDKDQLQNINSVIKISDKDVCLLDILKLFYSYEVSTEDGLPNKICINCVYQLTITQSFKYLIESSYKTLFNTINCSTYQEQDLDYEDGNYSHFTEDTEQISQERSKEIEKSKHKTKCKGSQDRVFCTECKMEFDDKVCLLQHCRSNHETQCHNGRECQYCDEKFEDIQTLIIHNKLHLNPYLCKSCWKGYFTLEELSTHSCIKCQEDDQKINEKNELRQCDQCGRKYAASYISCHMKTHSEERTYKCKLCPKRFKVRNGLHSHIQWTHKRTRNHVCEICNRTFISSGSRSMHVRKCHLNERKYRCECSKRFFSKSELDRHMLTHTGAKNFHCSYCEKSYQTRYGLNVHLKCHTSVNNMND